MRVASAFVLSLSLTAPLACGLESSGPSGTPVTDSGMEDRGTGVTDSGTTCLCAPPLPSGWAAVAYQVDLGPACSGDYGGAAQFVKETSGGGAATCACDCVEATAATCAASSIAVKLSAGSCSGGTTFNPSQTGCYNNQDFNTGATVYVQGSATLTPTGGMCTKMENPMVPARTDHLGQYCPLTGALGSGCGKGDACIPNVPSGFLQCVVKSEPNAACPPGFPTQHRVGIGINDDRGCTPCTCTPDAVCAASVVLWSNDQCGGNQVGSAVALDGSCHSSSGAANVHSMDVEALASSHGCTKVPGTPAGSVSLASEMTVCCTQ